jgi:hypothetical protein
MSAGLPGECYIVVKWGWSFDHFVKESFDYNVGDVLFIVSSNEFNEYVLFMNNSLRNVSLINLDLYFRKI